MTSLDISDAPFGMTSIDPIPVHRQLLAATHSTPFNLRREMKHRKQNFDRDQ